MFNPAHWHLILNHLPLFLVMTGSILLPVGIWMNSRMLRVLSLIFLVGAGITILPTYYSGEKAEHMMEDYGGISDSLLERHETWAEYSWYSTTALGFFALVGLAGYYVKEQLPVAFFVVLLLLSLTTLGVLAQTAQLGGKARHVEIRTPANR
ncbi:MAG: hypothetical protein ABEK50_16825 [bacterium]